MKSKDERKRIEGDRIYQMRLTEMTQVISHVNDVLPCLTLINLNVTLLHMYFTFFFRNLEVWMRSTGVTQSQYHRYQLCGSVFGVEPEVGVA